MKNWLLVAVLVFSVGLSSVSASPIFENRSDQVVASFVDEGMQSIGVEDSFVWKPSSGRSGGSFSGSRSSGSFSRPSSSPSKSSGGWGSSSSTTKSSGGWSSSSSKSSSSTSKPVTPTNKTASSVDSKVNAATKSTGKTYSSKEAAVSSFKAAAAKETAPGGKFTSQYKTEPATRPAHIPTTYNNHTVVYNPSYGGYGYWSGGGPGLGTWMMYDMLSDAVMLSAMSHHHGYYTHGTAPVYVNTGPASNMFIFIMGLVIILIFVVAIYGAWKSNA